MKGLKRLILVIGLFSVILIILPLEAIYIHSNELFTGKPTPKFKDSNTHASLDFLFLKFGDEKYI